MAKQVKISAADIAQAAATLDKALNGTGKLKSRFKEKRNGKFRERLAEKQYRKFLAGGGKAGDWQSFLDWLIENLPKIIAMIMALFPA